MSHIPCLVNHPIGSMNHIRCSAAGFSVCESISERKKDNRSHVKRLENKANDGGYGRLSAQVEDRRNNEKESVPEDLEPPKLVRQTGIYLDAIENNLNHTHEVLAAKDDQHDDMLKKLREEYDKRVKFLEEEREREKKDLQDIMAKELDTLEKLEREASKVEIKAKIDSNIKEISTIKKKKKAQDKAVKLTRLSQGGSSVSKK